MNISFRNQNKLSHALNYKICTFSYVFKTRSTRPVKVTFCTILTVYSVLVMYFMYFIFEIGANGKGSIGIGINSRVKEVVNVKATNIIEVQYFLFNVLLLFFLTSVFYATFSTVRLFLSQIFLFHLVLEIFHASNYKNRNQYDCPIYLYIILIIISLQISYYHVYLI